MDLSHLRIFGCTFYAHIQAAHRDRLEPKAVKYGYSIPQKGTNVTTHTLGNWQCLECTIC